MEWRNKYLPVGRVTIAAADPSVARENAGRALCAILEFVSPNRSQSIIVAYDLKRVPAPLVNADGDSSLFVVSIGVSVLSGIDPGELRERLRACLSEDAHFDVRAG